jgi:hypothetical protein
MTFAASALTARSRGPREWRGALALPCPGTTRAAGSSCRSGLDPLPAWFSELAGGSMAEAMRGCAAFHLLCDAAGARQANSEPPSSGSRPASSVSPPAGSPRSCAPSIPARARMRSVLAWIASRSHEPPSLPEALVSRVTRSRIVSGTKGRASQLRNISISRGKSRRIIIETSERLSITAATRSPRTWLKNGMLLEH